MARSGEVPTLELTSRIATHDHTVDLAKPGTLPKVDPKVLAVYTEPTELLPTDGIVRETAQTIVKGVRGGHHEQARAIYEWVVENTFRDPKTRGCGIGDIKTMLETKNLGGNVLTSMPCVSVSAALSGSRHATSMVCG